MMPHQHPHKPVHHVKPKYKKLALIAAAAAVLSTTSLPGMPVSTVHASANDMSASTSQQIGKTNDSSSRINLGRNDAPIKSNSPKQENKAPQVKENIVKTSGQHQKAVEKSTPKSVTTQSKENTTEKATRETNEKNNPTQATKDTTKSPVARPKTTKENSEKANPPQPAKDTTKDQSTSQKTKEETKPPVPGDAPHHYKDVLDISATAYAPGAHDNDQWGDKTYTGTTVRPGIIAVDPKLIPLGSRVYIEYPDGHGEYATAEDTGGAIKGNRIDVAKQTVNEAEDFGIQKVKVYVVNSPKNA